MAKTLFNPGADVQSVANSAQRRWRRRRLALGISTTIAGTALLLLLIYLICARQQIWWPTATLLAGFAISGLLTGYLLLLSGRADPMRAEESLLQEQRLLREMLDLQERERKLVAYEIHDGPAQQLTGALYKFESVHPLSSSNPSAAEDMLESGIRLLRQAMAEIRRLISGLRPPMLNESGLVAAIACLIADRREQGGPEIEFVPHLEVERLASPLESAIFRIVQECLTNACRYSQSDKVCVRLELTNGRVRIEVQDWGVGFDPSAISGDHFGLLGIHERARLLGGSANVHSKPGQGTRITVELPLVPQA